MNSRPASSRNVSGSLPNHLPRQSASRSHAHSLSIGSLSAGNRIDRRRKSSSANNAVATAVRLGLVAEQQLQDANSLAAKHPRRPASKSAASAAYATSLPSTHGFGQTTFDAAAGSAIADGFGLEPLLETGTETKSRNRRASDGSRLPKSSESKRAVNGELKCETCGKGYKHSSCLHKHLWEHTPEWAITSKLLISKHQQVQLLEAASVLMQITQNATDSDVSSPDASSSDLQSDAVSSKDGSPPPRSEDHEESVLTDHSDRQRLSGASSMYSQSYQSSVFSEGRRLVSSHLRQLSSEHRPYTAATSAASYTDDDKEEMSAAFNLLSCSYGGTPVTAAETGGEQIPPVPPLPAKYLGRSVDHLSGSTITGLSHAPDSFVRGATRDDIDMVEEEQHLQQRSGYTAVSRSDDDEEEGMFGRMEE